PTTAPTASAPTVADADKSVCGLSGFETESSLTAAPDNDWELVGTMAAPVDKTGAGPGSIEDDGFRSCYAHTAEGSLFAAVNFLAIGTDATLRPRLVDAVQEGPGRDSLEEAAQNAGETSSSRGQVAGFKIGAYDGSSATVDLAINYSDGQLVSLPLKLTWEDGDWKMVVSETGGLPLAPAALQNLGGYIPWAGA
uniref:hypothetical protein n=1 Tax=Agromyces sp. GXS1127 TaxID=3424181 RepID=UPI003D31E9D4